MFGEGNEKKMRGKLGIAAPIRKTGKRPGVGNLKEKIIKNARLSRDIITVQKKA